jgi:nucleotide-binding universal stress UspA family protein
MFKHVLIPTDGSYLSQVTVNHAIEFAKETKAKLTFFYAEARFPIVYYGMGAIIDSASPHQFQQEESVAAKAILEAAQDQASKNGVESDTLSLASDSPYLAIINAAEKCQCDLIFMASHGRRGIDALLLGSETQKVLTHSRIPVLVFR